MARQVSPNISPEAAYVQTPSAQSHPGQAPYYEASGERQLISDEMMDNISRIAEAGQGTDLSNGENTGLPPGHAANASAVADPASPITPQLEPQPLASPMSTVSQQRPGSRLNSTSSDQYGDGGNKRKRSKVSRACDECRRKKIRCDATKDDGTIDTCSNCKRINSTCAFTRQPMKRGPSKGYIKELSERVQQVENQMESQRSLSQMGPPMGFRNSTDGRQSLDSNAAGLFESTYSPTEPSFNKKRTFSAMSEGHIGMGPFAQPQYTGRDRMPSHGWSLVSPQGYPQTPRYSVAVAPDQLPDLPPTSAVTSVPPSALIPKTTQPFWAEGSEQQSLEKNTQKAISIPAVAHAGYQHYLGLVHPILPLLPSTWDAIERHLQNNADEKMIEVFTQTLSLIQDTSDKEQSTTANPATLHDLSSFIFHQSRKHSKDRSQSETFLLLWLCGLLYIKISNDISPKAQFDKQQLLQVLIDNSFFLVHAFDSDDLEASKVDINSDRNLARRAFIVIAILARLYSFSSDTEDVLLPDSPIVREILSDTDDIAMLSDATAVLTHYFYPLLYSEISLPLSLMPTQPLQVLRGNTYWLSSVITDIKTRSLPEPMSVHAMHLTRQLDFLIQLLITRNQCNIDPLQSPLASLAIAGSIVDYLAEESYLLHRNLPGTIEPICPIVPHLFVFAGITLLEFSHSMFASSQQRAKDQKENEDDPAIIARHFLSTLLSALNASHITTSEHSSTIWSVALRNLILKRHPKLLSMSKNKAKKAGVITNGANVAFANNNSDNTDVHSSSESAMQQDTSSSSQQQQGDQEKEAAAEQQPADLLAALLTDEEAMRIHKSLLNQDFTLLGRKGYMTVLGKLNSQALQS